MVSAPTRRVSERRAGDLATTCWAAGHDHLNQRSGFPPVQCLPIHKKSQRKPRSLKPGLLSPTEKPWRENELTPQTLRCYPKADITQGADRIRARPAVGATH